MNKYTEGEGICCLSEKEKKLALNYMKLTVANMKKKKSKRSSLYNLPECKILNSEESHKLEDESWVLNRYIFVGCLFTNYTTKKQLLAVNVYKNVIIDFSRFCI